jgi:predicted NBD/HSP70 family sugar kinase
VAANPLRPRGSNQVGLGQFNERVVLQAIRLHGPLAKAELARLTHLTAQTVALIIARLEADALVVKRDPVRGKVGQPSVPIALNPDGAYSIGVHIGRRRLDVLLIDFDGQVRERAALDYAFPDPDRLFPHIGRHLAQWCAKLGAKAARRIQGIGIAAPLALGDWRNLLGVEPKLASKWEHIDLAARAAEITALPVQTIKDTAAACVAELVVGRGRSVPTFLYMFVDTFIGGGLVVDSQLYGGRHGNAGAVGSMPHIGARRDHGSAQLLSIASLFTLEAAYEKAGLEPGASHDERALQGRHAKATRRWLEDAAPAIALAIQSSSCLLDLDGVIIDGAFGRGLLDELLRAVEAAFEPLDWQGVARPALHGGTVGSDARAIGGALLPLYSSFAPDREVFLKLEP